MFAVAGRWSLDPAHAEQQRSALGGIVEGVRQRPGFVRGFWSRDAADPAVNITYIVFEQQDQAEEFMAAVRGNAPAQTDAGVASDELRLVEVVADA
jgi:quinol monooxygenase YgiN